jgi:hypothetical protein
MIGFILNTPYTLIGLIMSLISGAKKFRFFTANFAFVVSVRNIWWDFGYMKNARAVTVGHVVILGPNIEKGDLEHELIHAQQYQKAPLIHPFLYMIELFRHGYRNNKYEVEAYNKAGNEYNAELL